jgi:hypothetical protein
MQPDSTELTRICRPEPTHHASAVKVIPLARLEQRVDGKLWLVGEDKQVSVHLVRCFPWTEPARYLSLRDEEGEEQAFVTDPSELDRISRDALQAALARSSFVLEVVEILEIDEDFELRTWRVQTAQGPRGFQTPLDSWPLALRGGGLVISDLHGDLYRISNPNRLNAESKRLLWAFMD